MMLSQWLHDARDARHATRAQALSVTATRYRLWVRLRRGGDTRDVLLVLSAHDARAALDEALDLYRLYLREYVIDATELRTELRVTLPAR